MQGYRRHLWFYRAVRLLLRPFVTRFFPFEATLSPEVKSPYIVVANHTTDWDSIFVSLSFPRHMYYVASEHIYRSRVLRAFFRFWLDPIVKRKGGADVTTAMQMLRRTRRGMNVALFAEGNKSFHGRTCPVHPATGTLVKTAGATLITYRITGGYFASPRWAHTLRRGKVTGAPVGMYPPEQLAAMTGEAINALIARDIREDAYARQAAVPLTYRGRRLAEGIGNALYLCPRCMRTGSVTGKGNRLQCACGLRAAYLPTGSLQGEKLPFTTLTQWGDWQREALGALLWGQTPPEPGLFAPAEPDAPRPAPAPPNPPPAGVAAERFAPPAGSFMIADAQQTILRVLPDHRAETVARGTLSLGHDGLRCGDFALPLAQVQGLEIYGRNTLVFSDAQGNRYTVRTARERCGLIYFDAYRLLQKERG